MEFEFSYIDNTDVVIIKRKVFLDYRGNLTKEYEISPFRKHFPVDFKEEYVSFSKKDVLRGLHFQKNPLAQGKYISVISGSIFDVAVDLREDSEQYMRYVSSVLRSEEGESIWIPEGYAHGFLSLEDNTVVLNRCTNEFNSSIEGGIRWDDPKIAIKWPLDFPILSPKDMGWPYL